MEKHKIIKLNILTFIFFVTILTLSKILPHPPNFTPLFALIIFSSLIIQNRIILVAVISLSLLISDIILGIYQGASIIILILIFIALTVPFIFKKINLINIFFSTIYSSFVFYIFSSPIHVLFFENKKLNLETLIISYYDGLPFFVNTITSTFVYSYIFAMLLSKSNTRIDLDDRNKVSFSSQRYSVKSK